MKQTRLDENSGVIDEFLLVFITRWVQRRVMHIIGVAYTMTHAMIKKKKKHALIDNVCMTIQLYDKYLVKYIMIFLQSILNMSYTG